jgi:hypothetical protein
VRAGGPTRPARAPGVTLAGFASTMEGNLLTEYDQWSKLRRVTEAAARIWS